MLLVRARPGHAGPTRAAIGAPPATCYFARALIGACGPVPHLGPREAHRLIELTMREHKAAHS